MAPTTRDHAKKICMARAAIPLAFYFLSFMVIVLYTYISVNTGLPASVEEIVPVFRKAIIAETTIIGAVGAFSLLIRVRYLKEKPLHETLLILTIVLNSSAALAPSAPRTVALAFVVISSMFFVSALIFHDALYKKCLLTKRQRTSMLLTQHPG